MSSDESIPETPKAQPPVANARSRRGYTLRITLIDDEAAMLAALRAALRPALEKLREGRDEMPPPPVPPKPGRRARHLHARRLRDTPPEPDA